MKTNLCRSVLALGAFAAAAAFGCAPAPDQPNPSHNDILGKPDLVAKDASKDLKQTYISATLTQKHRDGVSIVWCSTLQLAWNELGTAMGSPLGVGTNEMALALNAAKESKADLDDGSYVAMAGFGQDGIVEAIKKDLLKKFAGAASPSMLPSSVPAGHILAYSYLFKNLAFEHPFIRRKTPLEFGGEQVKSFGLWDDHAVQSWGEIASQVIIHTYTSPTQWTVELKNKSNGDRLIFARLTPGQTLSETVESITKDLRPLDAKPTKDTPHFAFTDTLMVPLFNFDITRSFDELTGLAIHGSKVDGVVDYAKQNIRFRLDEKGAVLKSEAAIGVTGAAMPKQPKEMICDGPFAILMMRKDAAHPYFAAWIDNPELLVKWK